MFGEGFRGRGFEEEDGVGVGVEEKREGFRAERYEREGSAEEGHGFCCVCVERIGRGFKTLRIGSERAFALWNCGLLGDFEL